MKRTLYDITDDMRAFDDLLEQAGGDVTDEAVMSAIEAWMNELDTDLKNKVDGYAAYIQELLALADARKAEAKRLSESARSKENAAKALKERLMFAMQERNLKKIETDRFSVSWQVNGGKPALDVSVPAEMLPSRFQSVTISPNNDAIRVALDAGEEVPGCMLMDRGTSLRIR